jgi:hypothetical protein
VATGYELAANYLAFIKLASIPIWLQTNESALLNSARALVLKAEIARRDALVAGDILC